MAELNPIHSNLPISELIILTLKSWYSCLSYTFQPDFTDDGAIREYRWFLDNCGIQHENETNGITYEDYKNNTCLWNFDLTPDMCNSFHLHETKTGSMDVSVAFKTALTKPVYMIVYACYNSAIAIDADRNVRVI